MRTLSNLWRMLKRQLRRHQRRLRHPRWHQPKPLSCPNLCIKGCYSNRNKIMNAIVTVRADGLVVSYYFIIEARCRSVRQSVHPCVDSYRDSQRETAGACYGGCRGQLYSQPALLAVWRPVVQTGPAGLLYRLASLPLPARAG